MSKAYLVVDVSDLPEVVRRDESSIVVGGWEFDVRDVAPTREDVVAWASAVRWFEQHPEVVPDGD